MSSLAKAKSRVLRVKSETEFSFEIRDETSIYDCDTVKDVWIPLAVVTDWRGRDHGVQEIYPDVVIEGNAVGQKVLYQVVDVRVDGCDTPEKRVSRKRSAESRKREKAAAKYATAELKSWIANAEGYRLRNPEQGKYCGRIVADIELKDKDTGEWYSVSARIISEGLGYAYHGGKKRQFDDWWGDKHIPEEYY